LEIFVRALAPYIGENMARASVRGHFEKLGLGASVDADEIQKLADALGAGLSVFVGREKAIGILGEARRLVLLGVQVNGGGAK
jgi:hypothetical protein